MMQAHLSLDVAIERAVIDIDSITVGDVTDSPNARITVTH